MGNLKKFSSMDINNSINRNKYSSLKAVKEDDSDSIDVSKMGNDDYSDRDIMYYFLINF